MEIEKLKHMKLRQETKECIEIEKEKLHFELMMKEFDLKEKS